jgi:hypothetical protein
MPLIIYLDDCLDRDWLIALLRHAGYTVISPREVGTDGLADPAHLEYAARHSCALLTANTDDFEALHHDWQSQGRTHAGIFLVYQEGDVTKDMTPHDIVRAIDHLMASGLPIANELHRLNFWQ